MLKNCFLPVNYNKPISQTCGEIICENLHEFIISCKVCKIKVFEFEEFLRHFKKVHLAHEVISTKEIKLQKSLIKPEDKANFKNFKCIVKLDIGEEGITEISIKDRADEYIGSENEFEVNGDNDESDGEKYLLENSEDDTLESEEDPSTSILRKSSNQRENVCKICNKTYGSPRRLKVHVKLAHLRGKPYKCSFCDQAFAQERSLKTHIAHNHTGYDCPECQQNFNSKRNLNRHMLVLHIGKKDFVCTEINCGKAFAAMTYLKDHQRQCHSNQIYICEECGFKCKQRESFNIHKRKHKGEKPFACPQCDRCFISKSLLAEHKACHETERKHVCDICGKSFNRHKALFNHKHLHSDVKKFVCKICGSAYAQAPGLSAHMRKHREAGRSWKPKISPTFQFK